MASDAANDPGLTPTPAADAAIQAADGANAQLGTHTEAPGGHEPKGPFPPFDPTFFVPQLFWLAITFGVLYILMARRIVPHIRAILEDREGRIVNDLHQADLLKKETDQVIAAYEADLANARRAAGALAEERRAAAAAELAAKRAEVEAGLAKRLAEAEEHIRGIKAKALAEVDAIATDAAEAVISHLVPLNVDRAEVARAVSAAGAAPAAAE
ncbi:F0F1 ATP synthase subunit B [Segnochrobactrum spirostomi]|uniref:ATP synthase subunit b n=1 Tax=Segnochrobactrum spirostomi TaxID=2608987 RepID=A0A6A7Y5E9_9HYPH|nr:F0F1 ATP synthase subunit B [Segnochrobactrum spirostomi]MQT13935.1 F0F1 ATP synthase subunit B [Segnochrobactrum spirostomi]